MNDLLPNAVADLFPANLRPYALYIVGGSICFLGLLAIMVLLALARFLFGGKKKTSEHEKDLTENLTEYPDLKKPSGDRQLRAEGVPVRLRLVVIAPAGRATDVDLDELDKIFEKLLPGLGEIYKNDKPRVKVWPTQISYEGFGNHFHKCMETGAEEGEQTRWVLIAGRIKIEKRQFMLGLALQSIKPNTIGRRTIDAHEWVSVLRVRVKE